MSVDEEVPDEVVNFGDVMRVVQGFQSQDYPFSNPDECPHGRSRGEAT